MNLEPFDSSSSEARAAASTTYQVRPGLLTESSLILQYISDNYSAGEWRPQNDLDARRAPFFTELIRSSLLLKIDFCVMLESLASVLPFGIRHVVRLLLEPVVRHFVEDQKAIYGVLEEALSGEKRWFGGDRLGLADFNASFAMDLAVQRGYLDGQKFPQLREWHERVVSREAYKRALVKGEVYDLKKFA